MRSITKPTAAVVAAATLTAGLAVQPATAADPAPSAPLATLATSAVADVEVKSASGSEVLKTAAEWKIGAGVWSATWKADNGHDKASLRVLAADGATVLYTGAADKSNAKIDWTDAFGRRVDDVPLQNDWKLAVLGYGTFTFKSVDATAHQTSELKAVAAIGYAGPADATGRGLKFDPTAGSAATEVPKDITRVELANLPDGWRVVSNAADPKDPKTIRISVAAGSSLVEYAFAVSDHTVAELKGVTAVWRKPDGTTGPVDGFDASKGTASYTPPFGVDRVDVTGVPAGWTAVASGDKLTWTITNDVDNTVRAVLTFAPVRYDLSQLKAATLWWIDADGGNHPVTGFDATTDGAAAAIPYSATGVALRDLPDGWTASATKDEKGFAFTAASPDPKIAGRYRADFKHDPVELKAVTATGVKADGTRVPIAPFDASKGTQYVDAPNGVVSVELAGVPAGWKTDVAGLAALLTTDDGAKVGITFRPAPPAKSVADAFEAAYERASKAAASDVYERDSRDELAKAVAAAGPTHDAIAVADETILRQQTKALDDAFDALLVAKWTFDGRTLTKGADGVWGIDGYVYGRDPAAGPLAVAGGDGSAIALKATETSAVQGTADPLGVVTHSGTLDGVSAKGQKASISYSFKAGAEITLADGTRLAYDAKADAWTATAPAYTLDAANEPSATEVRLTDGTVAKIAWQAPKVVKGEGTTRIWRAEGVAEATVNNHKVEIAVSASRAYDPSLKLSLTRRSGDGASTPIDLKGGAVADVADLPAESSIAAPALPQSAVGDQYQVAAAAGNVADVSAKVEAGLGDDGTREWTVTVGFKDETGADGTRVIRIEQPFEAAKPDASDPKAALKSITVNGQQIEGWDPDVLDYTIRAGEKDRVVVEPVTAPGQTAVAGDARQTAYTTVQSWTVTADGQSRVYTVTLVRDHAEPTADEAFKPADARDMGGVDAAPADTATDLESVGYVVGDAYTAVDRDEYTIPEGGTFAYMTYKGQVAKVGLAKVKGMTWRYDIGVLAPDGLTYASHRYTVTYITAATTKAELTSISVDGKPVDGFEPAKTEYAAAVANPERYVVTAQWDKQSGMSLTNHKDGRTVTLTATSADGLNSRTYTVTVSPLGALAQTGLAAVGAIAAIAAAVGLGAVLTWATRRKGADDGDDGNASVEE